METKDVRAYKEKCLELAIVYRRPTGDTLTEEEILALAQKYYEFITK